MSLKLRKLDLHVHTPASHDFNDKNVTAEQIIEHAQKVGLDAIAVTDHNTVDYIDVMKNAAKKKGFTIFPGFEVSCGGAQNGSIHVIGLFDPTKTKDDLQKVLGKLEIKGQGDLSLTEKSVSNVVDIIRESEGLPVLAHANSSHGALSDIRGNPRIELAKNPNLVAIEATAADFVKIKGTRLIDIFDGVAGAYKRKIAVYKSSDNRSLNSEGHCIQSIGTSFTYFKMGALSIESLRQCFEDRDSRIIQDYEIEKINSVHPRITSLSISGGFLNDQVIKFDPGMNSIIGGTGTGKSLVIEFLRFAFGKKPHDVLFNDHKEKLQKQLCVNGEIKVVFRDGSGEEYELLKKYEVSRDPYLSSTSICINKNTGKPYVGDLSSLFPTLIYSQNEILEITRDDKAQLHLLDNFRNFESYKNQADNIVRELGKLDRQLFQAVQDSENLEGLNKQLGTVEERLVKLAKHLGGTGGKTATDSYLKLHEQRTEIESKIEFFDNLLDKIDSTISGFEDENPGREKTPKTVTEKICAEVSDNYAAVTSMLKVHRKGVEGSKKKALITLTSWLKSEKYDEVEKKYKEDIKLQKKEETLETERKMLVKEKQDLGVKIVAAEKAAKQYSLIRKKRLDFLESLKKAKDMYFIERSKQAGLITSKSGGKLKIVVQSGDNKLVYVQMLKKLKVGSQAEKKEIEKIADLISPKEFVEMVLDKNVKNLEKSSGVTAQKAESIINELTNTENLLETLGMQYLGYPEDRIEISYQKKDGNHYPLAELSMGQKADALIMIALGDGTMPVIIDQPEDALDIPSIWSDICSRLRVGKHARQFIFTTHNSSISVSSDSDQFIILEANGVRGKVAKAGSIDQQDIKDDVVGHLEGGYGSYSLKRKKYGL